MPCHWEIPARKSRMGVVPLTTADVLLHDLEAVVIGQVELWVLHLVQAPGPGSFQLSYFMTGIPGTWIHVEEFKRSVPPVLFEALRTFQSRFNSPRSHWSLRKLCLRCHRCHMATISRSGTLGGWWPFIGIITKIHWGWADIHLPVSRHLAAVPRIHSPYFKRFGQSFNLTKRPEPACLHAKTTSAHDRYRPSPNQMFSNTKLKVCCSRRPGAKATSIYDTCELSWSGLSSQLLGEACHARRSRCPWETNRSTRLVFAFPFPFPSRTFTSTVRCSLLFSMPLS